MALTHLEPHHWWRWRSWRWPSARSVGRTEVSSSAGRALWGSRGPAPAQNTHTAAADEHNEEGLQHASCAHHPGQPQEEDNPKDVLQAGQVHPHEGAHAGCLWSRRGGGRRSIRGAPHCLAVPHLQGIQPENRLEKETWGYRG